MNIRLALKPADGFRFLGNYGNEIIMSTLLELKTR